MKKILFVAAVLFFGYVITRYDFSSIKKQKTDSPAFEETVESVSDGNSTQVFLNKEKEQLQLSAVEDANHTYPFRRGDFIVWLQSPHNSSETYVVRYHIPTKETFYVTTKDTAQNPRVTTEGKVVWLSWNAGVWELWYFDGYTAQHISISEEPVFADIYGEFVVFSYKDDDGWIAAEHSLQTGKNRIVGRGPDVKRPFYSGPTIYYE